MENKSCKICLSGLEVEQRCKSCNAPTRLFCLTWEIITEQIAHLACMVIDVNKMLMQTKIYH